jgi:hypothetical protein
MRAAYSLKPWDSIFAFALCAFYNVNDALHNNPLKTFKGCGRKTSAQLRGKSFAIIIIVTALCPVFANRNFDPLRCKSLAERCAFANTGELFGGEHIELVTEAGRQNGCFALNNDRRASVPRASTWCSDVDKRES